jgi:hypothetical protein
MGTIGKVDERERDGERVRKCSGRVRVSDRENTIKVSERELDEEKLLFDRAISAQD